MNWFVEFFTNNDNTLDITKLIVTQVVVVIVAFFSLYIGLRNDRRSKKNTFINTVTTNRIEWMQTYKQLINDFVSLTQLSSNAGIYQSLVEKSNYFDKLLRKRNDIVFHLNFQGYIDKKIITNITSIYKNMELVYEVNELMKIDDYSKKVDYILKNYELEIFNEILGEIKDLLNLNVKNLEDIRITLKNDQKVIDQLYSVVNKNIEEFNKNFSKVPHRILKEMDFLHNQLIQLSQVYLKLEWNRVKKESKGRMGSEWKFLYKKKADKMLNKNNLKTIDYTQNKLPSYLSNEKQEQSYRLI